MTQYDVFMSHSSVDKRWVIQLKNHLRCYKISVWLDRDEIRPGDSSVEALSQGLNNCRAVAFIVSPEAVASHWVRKEYHRALSLSTQVRLIPVILRDAQLPDFLQDYQRVDFRDETAYNENVRDLVWGITGQKPDKVLDFNRPGGPLEGRSLHLIWLLDRSGSMRGKKIQALNEAIKTVIPDIRTIIDKHSLAKVLIRVITFSDEAKWHVKEPETVEKFTWDCPVKAAGEKTAMGKALSLLADTFKEEARGRLLRPVLILISDGLPTDDFDAGLKELLATKLGKASIKLVVAVEQTADRDVLQKFVGDSRGKLVEVVDIKSLVEEIKSLTITGLHVSMAPQDNATQASGTAQPTVAPADDNKDLVWQPEEKS